MHSCTCFKSYAIALLLCSLLQLGLQVSAVSAADMPKKTGVFFGSFGDVDKEDEIRGFVTNTICDRDLIPLPLPVRQFIAWQRWFLDSSEIKHEYAAIGGASHMRATAQAQADAVAQKLRDKGFNAKGYFGANFTFPYVADSLQKAQEDGIEQLVVFYQGAQYSFVTAYLLFRDVYGYLKKHPEWNVKVVAVKSFSLDKRFADVLADRIDKAIAKEFPGEPAANVCVFLPIHGTIMKLLKQGDPYYGQAMHVVEELRKKLAGHPVYYGFQNHDSYPFLEWTEPSVDVALDSVAKDFCSCVLIDGGVSFTVDCLETLYDHGIAAKDDLLEKSQKAGKGKRVAAAKLFNSDEAMVDLLAALSLEALQGKGDIQPLARTVQLTR